MIRQLLILFIILSLFGCNYSSEKQASDSSISVDKMTLSEVKDLLKLMKQNDQQYRDSLYNGNKRNIDFYTQKITETDKVNLALLDKIIQKFGWPTISTFGNEGAETAFLIIWHHGSKRNILCKYFDLMEAAVKNKEMNQNCFKDIQERITQLSPDQIEY